MNAKILITGAAGSGKSPFARLLSAALGELSGRPWPVGECSDGLIRRAAHIQAHAPWPQAAGQEEWARYIRARKAEYRAMLLAIGDQLNADAPGKLVIETGYNADIIVGVRRESEAAALERKVARRDGECWFWIWVESADRQSDPNDRVDAEYFQKKANYSVRTISEIETLETARDIAADIFKRLNA